MLSNAYFLAKFHFDTAENEPAKNLQNFVNFPNFASLAVHLALGGDRLEAHDVAEALRDERRVDVVAVLGRKAGALRSYDDLGRVSGGVSLKMLT